MWLGLGNTGPRTQISSEFSCYSGYFSLYCCFISLSLFLPLSVSHSLIDLLISFAYLEAAWKTPKLFHKIRLLKRELAHLFLNSQNSQEEILTAPAWVRWPTLNQSNVTKMRSHFKWYVMKREYYTGEKKEKNNRCYSVNTIINFQIMAQRNP